MSKKNGSTSGAKSRKFARLRGLGLSLPAVLAVAPAAHAFQLYDGTTHGNNWEVNLNITTTYSGAIRVAHPSQLIINGAIDANGNDGDANLNRGVVDNNFEILPVLDIKNGSFGVHISGEYFVNTVYLTQTKNNQQSTVNPITLPQNYASQTKLNNGYTGRLLDAFVYDSWAFGHGQQFTLKAGQQTLFWGQALFSTNGISGGQAPIDAVQAQSFANPNPQAQSIFVPVGQIVATYQPDQTYTFQGYYQYQWVPTAQQGVGSYWSTTDISGPAGYRLIAAQAGGNTYFLLHGEDLTPPSQNGQFGLSAQAQYGNYDAGLFMLRYDSKTGEFYQNAPTALVPTPGGYGVGSFKYVYPRDIWLYGTSVSTTIGATNVAGEVSVRTHMPLVGSAAAGTQTSPDDGNASNNPLYPVGNVMVGLINAIYGSPALRFDPGGVTVTGEMEWDNVFRVTQNPQLLAPGRSQQDFTLNLGVTPAYFEVLPNLELEFPLSLSWVVAGNSQVWITNNKGTGSYSMGVTAIYKENWDASLIYAGYFGTPGGNPSVPGVNSTVDRGYVALSLSHTF